MRLKENTTAEESAEIGDHKVVTETGKIMYTEAECAACFVHGMASFMNLDSTFADYVSIVTGIEGIEAIIIPQGIFDVIELSDEPENYLDDMLGHLKADPEAAGLHINLMKLEDRERAAILSTISAYFASANNGFKPTEEQMKEHIKTELPKVVLDALTSIIKKQKQKEGK